MHIDQFESVFKSAIKDLFVYDPPNFKDILIVTDLNKEAANLFADKIQKFLNLVDNTSQNKDDPKYQIITADMFRSTEELLKIVDNNKPDLICTYRNLHSNAWKFPHSLGEYLDVLLQKVDSPILVVPHPKAGYAYEHAFHGTNNVMTITNHLPASGDDRLINYAAKFTEDNGILQLTHIEDQAYFDRIINAISKIPTINTNRAESSIKEKLLENVGDYLSSCKKVLKKHRHITIKNIVKFGHHLEYYRTHIAQQKINLLVMNNKDDNQLAMNGLIYPLAVELRQISLLIFKFHC